VSTQISCIVIPDKGSVVYCLNVVAELSRFARVPDYRMPEC
jgi:hypothetical protein